MSKQASRKKYKLNDSSTNDLLTAPGFFDPSQTHGPPLFTGTPPSDGVVLDPISTDPVSQIENTGADDRKSVLSATLAALTLPTPSRPDLAASSDTGSSNVDDVTRDTTPTLSGTAAARATVTVTDGATVLGTVVASKTGKWTFTTGVLGEGMHSFTVVARDSVGNTSAESPPLLVVIDTTPPAAPTSLDLATADDSGALDTDNATNRTSGLSISGFGEGGAIVSVYDDLNNNGVRNSGEAVLGTTTVNADGTFTVDISLTAGVHNIRGLQTDLAGNAGVSSLALGISVDTTPPPPPAGLDLAAEDDTGTSDSDNVTESTIDLTVTGSGEDGATVTLFDDANNDGIRNVGEATLGTATVTAGAFSVDIALAVGLHHVRAVQTDLAGNVGAGSSPLDITVEGPPPVAWIALGPVTADNIVKSSGVLPDLVPVTGTVGGEADLGDSVALVINGTTYAGVVGTGGAFSVDVSRSDLLADADAIVEASVTTIVDENPVTVTDLHSYWLDPAALFGGVSSFASANGQPVILGGLEYTVQNGNTAWSIANPDSDTLDFEVRSGDQWQYDSNTRERSELAGDERYAPTDIVTLNYDFVVEPGEPNSADWVVLGQFHADDLKTSPPYAMELRDERMAFMVRYLDDKQYVSRYVYTDPNNIQRGHSYDITVTARFSNDSNGFLKVWRDDVQIVDYAGPIGYGYDVYWKMGIYRAEATEALAVSYSGFFITDGALVA
ncbi:MAG TPA: Ig-like domain-containing protein [Bauldia sp.]|nr:Ig-like domain-containing protein [Bauldia sp.]